MRVWLEAASRAHFDMFLYEGNFWPIFGSHDPNFVAAVDESWKIVKDNFFKPEKDQIKVAVNVKVS